MAAGPTPRLATDDVGARTDLPVGLSRSVPPDRSIRSVTTADSFAESLTTLETARSFPCKRPPFAPSRSWLVSVVDIS